MIYKAAYIIPISSEPIKNGEILIRYDAISAVGRNLSRACPDESIHDLGQCAILPGFVNAHSHIDYTSSRNRYDALNLWDWIHQVGYRKDKIPTPEYALLSATLGAAECACSGITCLGDSTPTGAAVEAMKQVGLRGIAYQELFGQSMGDNYAIEFAAKLDITKQLQNSASKLIKVGLSPHAVYTTNAEVLEICAQSCAELDMPIAIHLAETWAEADYTMSGTGPIAEWRAKLNRPPMVSGLSPTRLLHRTGLLRRNVTLAHCVHVNDDEISLIADSGAGVAHCPRSNAYLGAGIAPLMKFRSAGTTLGLGTDSEGSCMRFDFFEEMRFALALARANEQDAGVLTANDVLRLATLGGAETLGLADCVGTLEVGKRADMVAVDLGHMLPDENLLLAIISRSPTDVVMTMVDGVEIARNGKPTQVDIQDIERKLGS